MEKLSRASRPLVDRVGPAALAAAMPTTTLSPALQALERRSALAHRQNERRRTREKEQKRKIEKQEKRQQWTQAQNARTRLVLAERAARREDWDMGPLAPRRDVGPEGGKYGTLDSVLGQGLDRVKQKDWGVRVGDRVVVVRSSHRDLGKIGKVLSVSMEKQECRVERVNMANMAVAKWQLMQEGDQTPFRPYPFPMSLSAVRLVAPLTDPETGEVRDTIINKLKVYPQRFSEGIEIPERRTIAGVLPEIEIPTPPREEYSHPESDCDTLRMEVEARTWTPTLSVSPMPPSIIDELRNKYSALRTRHDDAWIAAKDAENAARADKAARLAARMITPMDEMAMQRKAESIAAGQPELSEEMLAAIGEVMAKNLKLEPIEELGAELEAKQ